MLTEEGRDGPESSSVAGLVRAPTHRGTVRNLSCKMENEEARSPTKTCSRASEHRAVGRLMNVPNDAPPPPTWRALFDAYWSRAGRLPERWSAVAMPVRMAVVTGLFHTQIGRNGGQFWITNGYYASCALELRARLGDLPQLMAEVDAWLANREVCA
jgi:hypothetical protein